ncbi:thioredoxin 1 [Candidatus Electrothrix marina]|uniref:Thioredoxin 1 n=1 Tax=Candidatus Electrothrix marina TaxID=1859130 RepID=A0A3S3QPE8_9BACT|nr:thioredoxin 1 [Candidatus Electrothrix marina]
MKRVSLLIFFNLILFSLLLPVISVTASDTPAEVPVPGMITLVDLGAHKCIPCKMMAPILKKMTAEYAGRAAVIFIDVWKDKSQGEKFKISTIPTQIFLMHKAKKSIDIKAFCLKRTLSAN